MQGTLLTILLLILPILGVVLLRTNAAMMFFVLTGSVTLQSYLDQNVASFASSLFGAGSTNSVSLVIIFLPLLVAVAAFRSTVAKKMLIPHVLLAVGVGMSIAFLVPQFFSESLANSVRSSAIYDALQPYTSIVIAGSFLASVVILWLNHPKHEHHKKHGH